jgi:hypothetical protein
MPAVWCDCKGCARQKGTLARSGKLEHVGSGTTSVRARGVRRGGGGGEWAGGDWVGGWWVGGGDHNKGWVGNDTPDDAFGLGSDAVLVSSGCATVGYPLAAAAAAAPAPAAVAPAAGVGAVSSAPTVGSAALACEQHPMRNTP